MASLFSSSPEPQVIESSNTSADELRAEEAERKRRTELAIKNKAALDAQRSGRSQLRRGNSAVFIQ